MTEWIVSSIVLIVVVALVRQLLKGKISLRLQYALWAIVLVRLLVPITFGESKISVLNMLDEVASVVEQQEPVEEPTVSDPAWEPIGGDEDPGVVPSWNVGTPVITPGVTINPDPVISDLPEPVVPIVPDPGTASDPVPEPEPPAVDEPSGVPLVTVAQILTPLWLCGIAVVGLWFLFTNLRFWLRLRRSRRVLELDCPIRVYVTGAAETPCLFGLIRPAIYLTPEVAEDEVALRHVLAHELTHYHHWDHIWSVLRCVCLAVHWYNPLVWLAASLSRRDAELACDESTIRRIGEEERTAYGRTLIGLTCVHRSNLLHTATTMTGSKKSIKERIVLIAKKPKMAVYTLVAVILIAVIAVGCTFTGAKEKGGLSRLAQIEKGSITQVVLNGRYKLPEEQYGVLVDLLHQAAEQPVVKEKLAAEAGEYYDGVEYAMTVTFAGETCIISCIPDEDGGAELFIYTFGLGEDPEEYILYWIEFDELYQFIKQTVDAHVEEELPSDTPQAVLDCAEQVLADQLAEYVQENGKGDRTELIGLKQHETGTAGLNDAVFIYRITYNLHWDNAFEYYQHYMTLGYDSVTEEYILLGDFSADELVARYGTEEMLAKYDGSIFVAAAMELYQEWLEEDPRRQTVVFEAEILEISESKRLLTVWAYDKECAVEITKGLEIYGIDGMAITAADLAPGQIIEVTSANQVIYEPVETYGSCYVIRVIQDVGSGEEPADPNAELLAYFQDLLTWDGGTTHFNGALTCAFDSPEDINLEYVFYTGFPGVEEWSDFTEEEKAYLLAEGAKKNLGFGEIPAQKRRAKQLNDALQAYFGVSLSQVQIPDSWVYYKDTDSYYSSHGDTHVMQFFTVTKVEHGEDGLIYVYYTAEGPIYRQDETTLDGWEHSMVLTLRSIASHWGSTNDSGYLVLANQTWNDFTQSASGTGTAGESPMMKAYRSAMSELENVISYGFYNFGRYGGEGHDELIVETKTGEMSRTYHFFTYVDGEAKKIGTQEVATPYVLVASDGTGLILAGQWSKEIIWRITWEQDIFDAELLLEREVVADEPRGWPATIPMYHAKTGNAVEIRDNYWEQFAYYSNLFPIKLVLPKEWEELLTFEEGPSVRHSELDVINIYVEEGRDYDHSLSGHMGAVYRFDPVGWDTRSGIPGDFFEYGGIAMELGRTEDSVYVLQLSCALNEYWDANAPGFESYRVIQNCLELGAYEIYSYTPARSIEDTVTGFLNEYLTELYCYTNSKWLDYTTGSIHIYGVDELSEEDQAIVWAADRNISYLEDKADYRKLLRRYSEMYIQDLTITFANMKVSQNGKDATVNLDAFVSFYNEGNAEQLAAPQKTYEIRLAKIGGEWLITDVTEEGFDDTYKDNRAVLDKAIDALVDTYFSDNLVFRYDSNGDGMIQSVEFPYAEGEAFGLTGEYATLYTAVAEYAGRWIAYEAGGTYLVLPSITEVYGQYKDEQENINYICSMSTLYFDALGSDPGNWKNYNLGVAMDFVLATLDSDGNLVGFETWPNSPGTELAQQLYREYCGPLEDLAEAFINGTEDDYAEELMTEYKNEGPRLAQYLSYYFGE